MIGIFRKRETEKKGGGIEGEKTQDLSCGLRGKISFCEEMGVGVRGRGESFS